MRPMIVLTRSADALLAPVRLYDLRGAHGGRGRAAALARALVRTPVALFSTLICGTAWAIFLVRGVSYPLVGGDTRTAWGGPTLAGAWAVHFLGSALTLGVVLVITGALGKWLRQR